MTNAVPKLSPKEQVADLAAAYDRAIQALPSGWAKREMERRQGVFRDRLAAETKKRGHRVFQGLSEDQQGAVVSILRSVKTKDFNDCAVAPASVDPRITDEVVKVAVTAGLKAPPHIDDFCRAMLGAALPLMDVAAPVQTPASSGGTAVFPRFLDETTRNWLERNHPDFAAEKVRGSASVPNRASLETAHRLVTEIVVHGFENDEEAERTIRPFEPMIARALDAQAPTALDDVAVFWSAPKMRGESVFRGVGPMTPDLLAELRAEIRAANHGERIVVTGWQRFEA